MKLWSSMLGTTSAIIIYVLIFTVNYLTDQLPSVPESDPSELNITQAWKDLHVISTRPHPFNSHANDLIHAFLLSRLEPLAAAYPYVQVVDDIVSNATYGQTYFEGTNILVKIDGTEPDLDGAVLFSAHYDSVSTSYGTIDDGIAIVSMLQMVEKLSKSRSKRTAIFNFNNAEEDGLNGAYVFLQHPWSNLTRTFLNLEGASAGGRPILFRGTSAGPISAFLHKHVPHPHGTVLASDLYARGLLRSRTDYAVYWELGNMEGLDLAFYKGRSSYHTKYDAIPYLRGGIRALWSMMEALDGAGCALLDQGNTEFIGNAVYFDIFGRLMIMFSLTSMKIFNIAFLIMVPLTLLGFLTRPLPKVTQMDGSEALDAAARREVHDVNWTRFWIALLVAIASQAVLVLAYMMLNKYVIYSFAHLVYAVEISLAYLAFAYSLTSFSVGSSENHFASTSGPNKLLLQLVIFSSLLLLAATAFFPIGGIYPFSALALCSFLGWLAGSVYGLFVKAKEHNESNSSHHRTDHGAEPTEATPLIPERSGQRTSGAQPESTSGNGTIWFIQLLLVVPVPVVLFSNLGMVMADGMSQSMADGGPVWLTYAALSLIAVFLILPLAPFIPSYPLALPTALPSPFQQINSPKTLFRALLAVFVICATYTFGIAGSILTPNAPSMGRTGFPFTAESPVRIFFQQRVELRAPWLSNERDVVLAETVSDVRPMTYLTGVPYYLEQMIVPALPSAESGVECVKDSDRTGLMRCGWPSGTDMIPSPGGHRTLFDEETIPTEAHAQHLSKNPWIRSSILRLSSTSARFWIRGANTRTCRLYFDNARVAKWHVAGGTPGMQQNYDGFETKTGHSLSELRMWSRTWDREFIVDVDFVEGLDKINGSVACEWSEYESGRIGISDQIPGSAIPAYEEALSFFPKWATLTKLSDGLVEVWSAFQI